MSPKPSRTLFALFVFLISAQFIAAQTTTFTYQGKLTDNGNPASGNYDLQFTVWDALSGGIQQPQPSPITITRTNVSVAAGVFSVQLDFSATAFTGADRFLEIGVRPAGSPNPYTILSPRQPISSTPYALRTASASTADTAANATQLGGLPASGFIQNTNSQQGSANFNISGNGMIGGNLTVNGTLSLNTVNAITQYNLGGQRILSNAGFQNMFVGLNTGASNVGGCCNAFFGFNAGQANNANDNSFFGNFAGAANTIGTRNSFFGSAAGVANVSGTDNTFFGVSTGRNNTAGFNTFVGSQAGISNTTGADNTFLGYLSGGINTIQHDNTFVGFAAGFSNGTNDANGTASFNTFVGSLTGYNNTTGVENSFFGRAAGEFNTTGAFNSFFGEDAGTSNTTGFRNSFFGQGAGLFNTTGALNSFFGMSAGQQNTTQSNNTFVGHFAGAANGTNDTGNGANNNTFVGFNTGANNSLGGFNTFVGASTGLHNTTAFGNSFYGALSGENNTTGNHNAFFGQETGKSNIIQHDNTFIGSFAGLLTGGSSDTGGNANFNTFVGSNAGQSNEVGTSNTLVGANSDVGGTNLTNASAFGSRALVTSNNSLVLGAINGINSATSDTNVGIGTSTPGFKLHIAGHNTHDWPIIKLQNVDAGGHSYWLYSGAGGNPGDFGIYDETVSAYRFYINGSNGNVGINTAPVDRLDVFGDIRIGALNGCVRDRLGNIIAGSCGSDARLKREITPFPKLLNQLVQLQPVHFYWRAEAFPDRHFGTTQSFGLVAQDVEKVLPELVGEDEQGYKVVHYQKLPLMMLEAIKELKRENDFLRTQALENERERTAQRTEILEQQEKLEDLKRLVCADHPRAKICKAAKK